MLANLFERRAIRDPALAAWGRGDDLDLAPGSSAGVRVDEHSSMQLLAVFSCVRVISDSIAMLPVDVYRGRGGETQSIPTPVWIDQPNVDTDRVAFLVQTIVSLLLRGNAYWLVVRNDGGQITELWTLHPDMVQVEAQGMRKAFRIQGQRFDGELVHIPAMLFPGSKVGVDPISAARDAIGLGLATQTFGSKFFAQGAMPSGVITSPGIVTPEQAKELAQSWRAAHGGVNRSNLPAVLTGGAAYTPIAITPEQSQFLETRRYNDEQIYRLFGLQHPFTPMGGSSMTYANTEQLGTDVTRFTFMPWIVRLEGALSRLLPRPQFAKFNLDAFLRSALRDRYESYKTGIETGFLEVNEVRAWENLDPMDTPPADPEAPSPDDAMRAEPRRVEVRVVTDHDAPVDGVEDVDR
jgi:HK97 family phage portal protein